MAFKVKDLMITLLPVGSRLADFGGGNACACTNSGATCDCSPSCKACSSASEAWPGNDVVNPVQLAMLKERLRITLAEVEARERTMLENMKPQTLSEIELLERHLGAALEELRLQKEQLEKKSGQE